MVNSHVMLSFIIPVYNVEKHIKECLDSILSQCTSECEIILVDDGSLDSSGRICDEFAKKNSLIKVIHKVNEGPASARNAGLELASGEYISFVDSDDRISQGSILNILSWIKSNNTGIDICFLQAIKFYSNGKKESLGDEIFQCYVRNQSKYSVLSYLASRPKFSGSACTKLFRNEFLKGKELLFPEDGRFAEDLAFTRDCILLADSFDVLDTPFYEYRQGRADSITSNVTMRYLKGIWTFISESRDILTINREPKDQYAKFGMSFTAYEFAVFLLKLGLFNGNEKKDFIREAKDNKWILSYGGSLKLKCIKILVDFFGIRIVTYILSSFWKFKTACK